jgi:hypothetical protein
MKKLAPRMVLACVLVLIPTVAAFGQQTAKDPFNPAPNLQNALTYETRGIAKLQKGSERSNS